MVIWADLKCIYGSGLSRVCLGLAYGLFGVGWGHVGVV